VQELTSLREHVLDQLASLREHLGQVDRLAASGPALLDPPATEASRPVTADFPADPDARPTGLPKGFDQESGPWDDVTVESLRAEQPEVDADPPVVGSGGAASGDDAAGTPIAESTDDKLNAIAADFDRDAPVDREFSDSDTDTFARVEPADESGVPLQQRTGLRAFADRAMGR
jgi:hypothetical protein